MFPEDFRNPGSLAPNGLHHFRDYKLHFQRLHEIISFFTLSFFPMCNFNIKHFQGQAHLALSRNAILLLNFDPALKELINGVCVCVCVLMYLPVVEFVCLTFNFLES